MRYIGRFGNLGAVGFEKEWQMESVGSGKSGNGLTILNVFAAISLVVCAVVLLPKPSSPVPPSMRVESNEPNDWVAPSQRDWAKVVSPHLQRCEKRIDEATTRHTDAVAELINRSRLKVPEFAGVALGLGSKWRIVADAIPYTRGGRHEAFMREQFEKIVLKSTDLEKSIESSIQSFLMELRSIEGKMLVELRADIEDFPDVDWSQWSDEDLLRTKFDQAISNAIETSGQEFRGTIGSQMVSLIAGEVLTQVAVRMGVSAGILGAGAASGWATFGIGVVAGIVIDQVIANIWSYWSNPKEELSAQIVYQLDTIQILVCQGDEQTMGLKQHFQRVADERRGLRRDALLHMLHSEKNR